MIDESAAILTLDLGAASIEAIEVFMDETADAEIFREILETNRKRPEVLEKLACHPDTPDDIRRTAERLIESPGKKAEIARKCALEVQRLKEKEQTDQKERLIKKIQGMSTSAKIKLAMKGNTEVRGILAKEPGKLIIMAVLENSKITDSEVAAVARNRAVIEDALRKISKNKAWMKVYSVQLALATNPKTPLAIAMQLVPMLKKKDLNSLSRDKGVSEGVRTLAKKLVKGKEL
jgi:hypothetical protein